MRRRKPYIYDKINRAIGEYYNGTKKVIAATELMNVCLNSVEASFQMIIDACKFAVPALYQLVKNLVFFVENHVFCIFVSTNWFKSRFQAQTGWFIVSHKVATRKKKSIFGKMQPFKNNLSYVNKKSW